MPWKIRGCDAKGQSVCGHCHGDLFLEAEYPYKVWKCLMCSREFVIAKGELTPHQYRDLPLGGATIPQLMTAKPKSDIATYGGR